MTVGEKEDKYEAYRFELRGQQQQGRLEEKLTSSKTLVE
jgi:hypothetical protein